MKSVHVICAVDCHIPYLKYSLDRLKNLYPNDDFAISSYHMIQFPNLELGNFCIENNILYYDAPQDFSIPILPYCEIVGIMEISHHFYQLDYDRVYLLHNDLVIFQDYKPEIEKNMLDKWSVICPLISCNSEEKDWSTVWEKIKKLDSKTIERFVPFRLTLSLLTFNKIFLNEILLNYDSFKSFYLKEMITSSPYGDCGLFDIDCFGFESKPILDSNFLLEGCWFSSKQEIIDFVKNNNQYKYMHLGSTHNKHIELYKL